MLSGERFGSVAEIVYPPDMDPQLHIIFSIRAKNAADAKWIKAMLENLWLGAEQTNLKVFTRIKPSVVNVTDFSESEKVFAVRTRVQLRFP
jgi:hypothetical protein